VPDDWGRDIAEVRSDLRALNQRVIKVERWAEEDSPEFHRRMEAFVTRSDTIEAERERVAAQRHKENSDRLETIKVRSDLWNLVIAFFGLVCTACMLYLAVRAANHVENDPSKIFHSEIPNSVYATNQESTVHEH